MKNSFEEIFYEKSTFKKVPELPADILELGHFLPEID